MDMPFEGSQNRKNFKDIYEERVISAISDYDDLILKPEVPKGFNYGLNLVYILTNPAAVQNLEAKMPGYQSNAVKCIVNGAESFEQGYLRIAEHVIAKILIESEYFIHLGLVAYILNNLFPDLVLQLRGKDSNLIVDAYTSIVTDMFEGERTPKYHTTHLLPEEL